MRKLLACLLFFLALNAFGGGIYGLMGAKGIPSEWLTGSPFHSYTFPSLFLFVFIGGTALFSSILVFKKSPDAFKTTNIIGVFTILWILIQIGIIGYGSWMQPFIASIGIAILLLNRYIHKHEI